MPPRSLPRLAAASLLLAALAASPARADDLTAALIAAQQWTAAPALAALEIRGGVVTREAVVGRRRSDDSEPARLDDVWATGSDGKPMTAALIARLVDRGLLRWDAPLAELLPALRPAMRPEYRAVTLAQLLAHRAGLPRDTADLAFFASFFADPRPLPEQRLAYVDRALREAPVAAPGGPANYSNTGFVLAGVIAEHITGRSYEDLMQREVFTPLAMTSARFAPTHDGQPRGHRDGAPSTARFTAAEHGNPPMFAPAGAELHLTLRDWARFCADQLAGARGRGGLLSRDSYARLLGERPGEPALGWGVQPGIAGRQGPVLLHAGSDGNWFAFVVLFPAAATGVLIASNAGESMGGEAAATALLAALLPELSPPAP